MRISDWSSDVCSSDLTTRFLYDGDELVAEYNGSGTLLRRYAHGKNVDDPVVWYEGTGTATPRFLHTEYQGSIVAVTSNTGAALAINAYDEYGIPATSAGGLDQYGRSEEHTSELKYLLRISNAVVCLKKTTHQTK